jgi:hypothetical protein
MKKPPTEVGGFFYVADTRLASQDLGIRVFETAF